MSLNFKRYLQTRQPLRTLSFAAVVVMIAAGINGRAFAQADQGAITGVVSDTSGASIPNAIVTLRNPDTNLSLETHTNESGVYIFQPIKVGNYSLDVTAQGFSKTSQQNVHVDMQARVSVNIQLKPGAATETIEVTSAPPLLQTEEGSSGQVLDTKTINDTPLNGRNWVFVAQLTAGVTPPSGSRGAGKGDFNANGQRSEQNNYILDGVDNNNNVVDFLNGASFVVRPPPDALSEFKVQTGAYSAEFGHSAGAVVNAAIKSGTNSVHGNLWEYVRNDAFDVHQWSDPANIVPKYRQNQFGGTLGFPIYKNKLFFFGDVEANRIIFGETHAKLSVPTGLMRQGDFSELLNSALVNGSTTTLYQPGSGGTVLQQCNGIQNKLCAGQISPVAQKILNLYPAPNIGVPGQTYNNYTVLTNSLDNTWQWDARMDWNLSQKDQLFGRFSYLNNPGNRPAPLGPILDGGGFSDDGSIKNLGENFAASETHVFSQSLTNEFRVGYNYGHFGFIQENANTNIAATIGLGGIPFGKLNGGLPNVSVGGLSSFGSPTFYVSNEYENVFQILDNVTKTIGNHQLRAGVSFQHIRFSTEQPTASRGTYNFNGLYTSKPGTANTGYGAADFLTDNMNGAGLSNVFNSDDVRWDRGFYVQDDWKASPRLTLNIGLRYELFDPYAERHGHQAALLPTGPVAAGKGTGIYLIPSKSRNVPLAQKFLDLLAKDNVTIQYTDNNALIQRQNTNIAPRFGFAYRVGEKAVVRGGYGIFFGGVESTGYYPNLGENYPFEFDSTFPVVGDAGNPNGNCLPNNCPTNGLSLATGFSNAIAIGLENAISTPTLRGSDKNVKTPYSQQYNLSTEYALSNSLVAQVAYVGSVSRHLQVFPDPNGPVAIAAPGTNVNPLRPFPDFGGLSYTSYTGVSSYNSFQGKLEKRYTDGLSFLATYTWSHSLDDAPTPLGSTGDYGFQGTNVVPIGLNYASSPFDVRHRVTINGNYALPVGRGQKYLNNSTLVDLALGGWATSLVFRAQTGEPFTVGPSNISTPAGAGARALRIADPFKAGGTPNSSSTVCPTKVRTTTNWYNPCSFANPPAANGIGSALLTGTAAYQYLGIARNQLAGPGYERVDMSLFKSFKTFREQNLQFRTDVFNLLNTPAYAQPGNSGTGTNGGQITNVRFFQGFTPDSRFFQFALKYNF